MNFRAGEAIALLERTPHALRCLLAGIPDAWLDCDEGPDTFSPREVLGHLIHGEKVDWMTRFRFSSGRLRTTQTMAVCGSPSTSDRPIRPSHRGTATPELYLPVATHPRGPRNDMAGV